MRKVCAELFTFLFLIIFPYNIIAQLHTIYDRDLLSRFEEGKKSYNVPDITHKEYSSVIYIDPSKSTNGNGTIDSPLNTWPSELNSNTAYLQKSGTKYDKDINKQSNDYILIGAYGKGERPIIASSLILTGKETVVREISIPDNELRIGKWPYTDVENCWVYDCEIKALSVFTSETKIIGNIIHNSGTDGLWTSGSTFGNYNRNIEIAYNHIYDVNMHWYPGATESEAPGDGIQAEASGFIHIHHNLIDRTSTGSKFCIIIGHQDAAPLDALVEHNVLYSPKKTENEGAFIYIKDNVDAVIRYNKFIDIENDGLIAIWAYVPTEIYGNLMVGVKRDFPPKARAYHNTCVNVAKPFAHVEFIENNILTTETSGTKGNNMYIDKAGLTNLFVDPHNGDFRLKKGSPAIGAGNFIKNWEKDMHGVSVSNKRIDMGAFVYSDDSANSDDSDNPVDSDGSDDSEGSEGSDESEGSDSSEDVYSNSAPIARAGNDQVVSSGSTVSLDASGSSDPDNDELSFRWTTDDTRIVFSDPYNPVTNFYAPVVSEPTVFSITLQVTDPGNASSRDKVMVTIQPELFFREGKKLNIARVIASDHDGNLPENTVDGDMSTRWSAEGNQWIKYNLTADSVYYIKTAWYKGDQRINNFDVEVSEDNITWKTALSDAATSGKTESFQTFRFEESKANYLRIKANGNTQNDWNSLLEIEVYGVPSQKNNNIPETVPEDIIIYPNPAYNSITIDLSNIEHHESMIHIVSLNGQIVASHYIDEINSTINLDISSLKSGIYLLRLLDYDNDSLITKRFVKR